MGAFTEIIGYLIQTVLGLLLLAMLLRFLLQVVRADFYNPISQVIVKVTNPMLTPMRKVVPGFGGIDVASLIWLVILQAVAIASVLVLNGLGMPQPVFLLLIWAVIGVLALAVQFYFFALLAMIILSWVAPGTGHPAVMLVFQLTEPVMRPFRSLLPPMGGLDLSPIFLFIAINIVQIILRHTAASVGLHPALVLGL